MKDKNFSIRISSDSGELEFFKGRAELTGDTLRLKYTDGQSVFLLGLDNNKLTIRKSGAVNYLLILNPEGDSGFHLESADGELDMAIRVIGVSHKISESKINISAEYYLESERVGFSITGEELTE
ncbi:MAG: DUF1934 family protein [Clostridiales bacterium]|nr:DUF1934 family protein [Clostridiales bacterium]